MSIRLFVDAPLLADSEIALPPGAARHAQVRRVQPGQTVSLFDGSGADWHATVLTIGRSEVRVRLPGAATPVDSELPFHVTLAIGMPANERMDMLVEKASELGVGRIQPLLTERSVLRIEGERAARKREHWQAVAIAACEQCGRARVPPVEPVLALRDWLPQAPSGRRLLLSLAADALPPAPAGAGAIASLSGPEGGLSPAEEHAARALGFVPTALGARVLRADTAPLALLAWLGFGALR